MTEFVVTEAQRDTAARRLAITPPPFSLTVKKGRRRSLEQNAYLWGVCYPVILEAGHLDGWRSRDLHEYFLEQHFGTERLEGFGEVRTRALHRSRNLTKTEFADYVAFIQQRAAELGIVIPDPEGL